MTILQFLPVRSRVLRLSTVATFACAMLILHACGDTTPLQPPPQQVECDTSSATAALLPLGTYQLANVDGTGLPIVLKNRTMVLASGRINLTTDSTFSMVQLIRAPRTGPTGTITDSINVSGTFSRCGTAVLFHARFGSSNTFHATLLQHVLLLAVPNSIVNTGKASGLTLLAFADNAHAYQCGSETSFPGTLLGSYTLISANGRPVPVLLPDSYPSAITMVSAMATLATSTYEIEARGTVVGIDSAVVEVSDSGSVEPCLGELKFTSTIRDTSLLVATSTSQLSLSLPASFVDFDYEFLGDASPIALVFQRNP